MGLEAECRVIYGNRTSIGKAQLETKELRFRGDFSLTIPLAGIKEVEARRGQMQVVWPDGQAVFELGAAAEKWTLKIRYPRSLIDKLGVKPESQVVVIGVDDEVFRRQLAERVPAFAEGKPKKGADIIFFGANVKKDLERLGSFEKFLMPAGAVWVVYPKGRKEITEGDVLMAGRAAALVDVKIVSFSESHSALKMVIPVARRK